MRRSESTLYMVKMRAKTASSVPIWAWPAAWSSSTTASTSSSSPSAYPRPSVSSARATISLVPESSDTRRSRRFSSKRPSYASRAARSDSRSLAARISITTEQSAPMPSRALCSDTAAALGSSSTSMRQKRPKSPPRRLARRSGRLSSCSSWYILHTSCSCVLLRAPSTVTTASSSVPTPCRALWSVFTSVARMYSLVLASSVWSASTRASRAPSSPSSSSGGVPVAVHAPRV
mmetsp:Transcript_20563/g.69912  ORF Transcript_20563/g.69912 Transcript_20563/m.69912 type:complete len:233 (+) Transcript_20563:2085-2783(+)